MSNAPTDFSARRMYHGTSRERAECIVMNGFKPSMDGMLGRGVYLSDDRKKVLRYARDAGEEDGTGWCILVVLVDVGRVKKINRQGHPLQKTWRMKGYDTAWVPPKCGMVPSGLSENCVANPRRIEVIAVDYQNYVTTSWTRKYPNLKELPRERGLTPADIGRHHGRDLDRDEEDDTEEEYTDGEETDEEEVTSTDEETDSDEEGDTDDEEEDDTEEEYTGGEETDEEEVTSIHEETDLDEEGDTDDEEEDDSEEEYTDREETDEEEVTLTDEEADLDEEGDIDDEEVTDGEEGTYHWYANERRRRGWQR